MNNRQLQPYDGFLVTSVNYFTDFDKQVLTDLYLPIIGTNSYSLYLYLWTIKKENIVSIDRYQHVKIINATGESLNDLDESLTKLEGIGLLRTYLKKDIIGSLFIYELSSPVSPIQFFDDDLLISYLTETVGEKVIVELRDKYTLHPANTEKFTEITKSFFDAFKFDGITLNKKKQSLNYQEKRTPNHPSFDSNLLTTLLNKYGIGSGICNRYIKQFGEFADFYNINELELVNGIVKSGCLKKDQFSEDRLAEYFNFELSNKANKSIPTNTSNFEQLNEEETEIVKKAVSMSPLNFAIHIKERFGGYLSNAESAIIRQLVRRKKLPNEVINILFYYEIKTYSSIAQKSTDVIANDWIKHKIENASSALIYAKNYNKRTSKTPVYRKNYSKKPVPKWFNESNKERIGSIEEDIKLIDLIKQEEEKRKNLEEKR